MAARYRCRACGHEWSGEAGWATCPVCVLVDPNIATWKDHYCDWLNYNAMFGDKDAAESAADCKQLRVAR